MRNIITDNPGGNPAIATDILCAEIRRAGIEPLVCIAFRDRSRNQAEILLFQLAAPDINNILVLTGDYPSIRISPENPSLFLIWIPYRQRKRACRQVDGFFAGIRLSAGNLVKLFLDQLFSRQGS